MSKGAWGRLGACGVRLGTFLWTSGGVWVTSRGRPATWTTSGDVRRCLGTSPLIAADFWGTSGGRPRTSGDVSANSIPII
eukprot:12009469-Karenia_brevis.AAC.1